MKKLLFLLIFSTLSLCLQAQYIINKEIYNSKDYIYQTGDKYKPAVAGTLSLLLNGAGQLVMPHSFGEFMEQLMECHILPVMKLNPYFLLAPE